MTFGGGGPIDAVGEAALRAALQRIAPIPDAQWASFRSIASRQSIAKQVHWLQAGEPARLIGFCTSGLFRMYYATPSGEEYNKSFCGTADFIASYSSLLLDAPAFFSIQALADSELLVFRYSEFRSLFDKHPCWERIGRVLIEQLYIKKETRERELLILSAEARYRQFLDHYGPLAAAIPQYHIASYLGITPVALSRIRRRINLG
ncbi:putative transcriptional regulator, Crp/Fnr family [Paenibacillus curdlanolyticus YK9]|uniref:Putative transcriptional regulator, Crp/Fnr family n=1 Tax=Paenibacillus curdlanolyticus YK9 TaxID=717606 RepID=E0IG17_9BACL|nr:Crp/Fnr family transcriptional regulator [Paenibacillus curdlanolyticus]EFM08597.1 putative transcriptional regulator, Crp/Fnr family [Paenibacillus curdlanolyticus YK9]